MTVGAILFISCRDVLYELNFSSKSSFRLLAT